MELRHIIRWATVNRDQISLLPDFVKTERISDPFKKKCKRCLDFGIPRNGPELEFEDSYLPDLSR